MGRPMRRQWACHLAAAYAARRSKLRTRPPSKSSNAQSRAVSSFPSTLALQELLDTCAQLHDRGRGGHELISPLQASPRPHPGLRVALHQLGNDVRVENDHVFGIWLVVLCFKIRNPHLRPRIDLGDANVEAPELVFRQADVLEALVHEIAEAALVVAQNGRRLAGRQLPREWRAPRLPSCGRCARRELRAVPSTRRPACERSPAP